MSITSDAIEFPIKVRWCGWTSDTWTLRNNGWQVFINEYMSDCEYAKTIDVALRDPHETMAIMGSFKISHHMYRLESFSETEKLVRQVGIDMKDYKNTGRIQTYHLNGATVDSWKSLQPSDGFMSMPVCHEYRLEDFDFFKYSEPAQEIYIPPASVDDCLNQILELQYPQQEELKKEISKAEVVKPIMEAKVYSLAA